MTAIFYPDCAATSPSGAFTVEARSPHNGEIPFRDGTKASDDDFGFKYREHQSNFRYQLTSGSRTSPTRGAKADNVVWERWQDANEDSPHELIVSDDGWSVIRTHGFQPEVIAVSPDGRDVVRVRVAGPWDDAEPRGEGPAGEAAVTGSVRHTWVCEHLSFSTAGSFWAGNSWPYFFRLERVHYFAWRTFWGQRLVLNLTGGSVVAEGTGAYDELVPQMQEHENHGAHGLLAELSPRLDEIRTLLAGRASKAKAAHPLRPKLVRAPAAMCIAAAHRVRDCVPQLRALEVIDYPRYSTGSLAVGRSGMVEQQYFRPITQHALRILGEEPAGHPAFKFTTGSGRKIEVPEPVADRRQRATGIRRKMSAVDVIGLIGTPDHVRRESHPDGTLYRWTEDWEYDLRVDGRWVTLRIVWEERGKQGRIADIQEIDPYWVDTDRRLLEILPTF